MKAGKDENPRTAAACQSPRRADLKLAYYPGCSLEASSREFGESVNAVLPAIGVELVEIEDWNCCGASSGHTTDELLGISLPARILGLAAGTGLDLLVPCVGCFKVLKKAQHALTDPAILAKVEGIIGMRVPKGIRVLHISEIFGMEEVQAGIRRGLKRPLRGMTVLPYYGCVTLPPRIMGIGNPENPQGLDAALEAVGAAHPDWPGKIECCGASLSFSRLDIVVRLVDRIAKLARASGGTAIATACPLCHANLDMRQTSAPAVVPAYITEIIGFALGMDEYRTWFKRHLINPAPLFEAAAM